MSKDKPIRPLPPAVAEYIRVASRLPEETVSVIDAYVTHVIAAGGVEWVSVEDRLPAPKESVLVCCNPGKSFQSMHVACSWDGSGEYWSGDNPEEYITEVTHWMPLPKPPCE